jgi:leucine carboxyl methyltransferase
MTGAGDQGRGDQGNGPTPEVLQKKGEQVMQVFSYKRLYFLIIIFMVICCFCVTPGMALAKGSQPNFRTHRKAQVVDGKTSEAIRFAEEVTKYLDTKYPERSGYVYMEESGTATTIHWFGDYESLDAIKRIQSEILSDKQYLALLKKAQGLFVQGSVRDTLLTSIAAFAQKETVAQRGLTIAPPSTKTASVDESKRSSRSAEIVAAWRAIAAHDPDERVRNPDYLAEKFIRPGFLETIGLSSDFELSRKWLKMRGIFTYYYVNARTHHMDTILKKVASEGVKQVVILGAGYDSRAYRFRKIFPDLKFFEVDLPATQVQKKGRLTEIFGSPPDRVAYAPIDFNTQPRRPSLYGRGLHISSRKRGSTAHCDLSLNIRNQAVRWYSIICTDR